MRWRSLATRIAAGPRSTPAMLAPKPHGAPTMLTRRPSPGLRAARVACCCSSSSLLMSLRNQFETLKPESVRDPFISPRQLLTRARFEAGLRHNFSSLLNDYLNRLFGRVDEVEERHVLFAHDEVFAEGFDNARPATPEQYERARLDDFRL